VHDVKKTLIIGLVLAGLGFVLGAVWWSGGLQAAVSRTMLRPERERSKAVRLTELEAALGRSTVDGKRNAVVPVALPEGRSTPRDEQELSEFVAWMRSLGQDELLRLSNAEFDFKESALVEMLQALRGEWVVPALGGLAVGESDPLLKAILVEGLVGTFASERLEDQRLLPILDTLMARMKDHTGDPYEVAHGLATATYAACARGGGDYMLMMSGYLENSDNAQFLAHGYLHMGTLPGGEETLKRMLASHPCADGRFGALEGLRRVATSGLISPEEVTFLGLSALETETNERNRLLLYEMMISTGGEEALTAVEDLLRSGKVAEIGHTVEFLAMKVNPARAQTLFQDLLRDQTIDVEAKQAIYNAMGLLQGEEGADFLLGLARDDELEDSERLAGLRGLWNRPVDERLAGELRGVFASAEDSELRTEALRMLVYGESEGNGIDLRELAVLDDDPAIRAEAIQLAAMQPSSDSREWLEERLFEDGSIDVKAAALGALVYQAHYTGDGDAVLGYLERARRFTDDEGALAMITEGERMVKDYDPRSLELELAEEAEFWGKMVQYTDGPATRAFQRQAKQLGHIVTALRATRDGRRAAR